MQCFQCGAETKVLNVRSFQDRVERRRRCLNLSCSYRFVTVEQHVRQSSYFGRLPPSTRLTAAEVREVKLLLAEGRLSQQQIAERVGMSQQQISKIKRGVSWGYVEVRSGNKT